MGAPETSLGLSLLTSLSDQFFAAGEQTPDFERRSLLQSTVVNEPWYSPSATQVAPARPDFAAALGQTGK